MAINATGSNQQPNVDRGEDGDAPEYVTKEELHTIINSAISKRTKSFETKLDELIGKISQTPTTEQKPEKEEKVNNSELLAMKKQLEALKAEKEVEVSKRKDTELRNQLKDKLTKHGVRPELMKAVMATLINEDKLIGYDESDQLVFKDTTGDLDLDVGLKSYFKADENKGYLSPKGIVGSGAKSYASGANKTSQLDSTEELAAKLIKARLEG